MASAHVGEYAIFWRPVLSRGARGGDVGGGGVDRNIVTGTCVAIGGAARVGLCARGRYCSRGAGVLSDLGIKTGGLAACNRNANRRETEQDFLCHRKQKRRQHNWPTLR